MILTSIHPKRTVRREEDYYSILLSKLGEEADKIIDEENKNILGNRNYPNDDEDDDYYSENSDSDDEYFDNEEKVYNDNLEKFESLLKMVHEEEFIEPSISSREKDKKPNLEDVSTFYDCDFQDLMVNDDYHGEHEEYDYDSDEYFQQSENFIIDHIEATDTVKIEPIHSLYKKKEKAFKFEYRKKPKPVKKVKLTKPEIDDKEQFEEMMISFRRTILNCEQEDEMFHLERLRRYLLRNEILGRLSKKKKKIRNSDSLIETIRDKLALRSVSNSFLIFKMRINEYFIFRLIVHHECLIKQVCMKTLTDMMDQHSSSDSVQ